MNKNNDNKRPEKSKSAKEDLIITDPQGSYTGLPEQRYEVPVQDADDL